MPYAVLPPFKHTCTVAQDGAHTECFKRIRDTSQLCKACTLPPCPDCQKFLAKKQELQNLLLPPGASRNTVFVLRGQKSFHTAAEGTHETDCGTIFAPTPKIALKQRPEGRFMCKMCFDSPKRLARYTEQAKENQ